jgi:uncharacterized damage-inducible protein DinB
MIERFHKLFIEDIRRRLFEENQARIHKCLDLISEEQLWYRNNENVNSVGNLILHLCGNITQYICSGILREKDERVRDKEFVPNQALSISQVLSILDHTLENIDQKLDKITPEMLLTNYEVQGFSENGTSILVHVTEHFSYHVGQITYLIKMLNNVDTKYYSDLDLNAKSS